jgi:hypothetical protein
MMRGETGLRGVCRHMLARPFFTDDAPGSCWHNLFECPEGDLRSNSSDCFATINSGAAALLRGFANITWKPLASWI